MVANLRRKNRRNSVLNRLAGLTKAVGATAMTPTRPKGPGKIEVDLEGGVENLCFGKLLYVQRGGELVRVMMSQRAGWVDETLWTVCPRCKGSGAAYYESSFEKPWRNELNQAVCGQCMDHKIPGTDVCGVVLETTPEDLLEAHLSWFEEGVLALSELTGASFNDKLEEMTNVVKYQNNYFWLIAKEAGRSGIDGVLKTLERRNCAFLSWKEEIEGVDRFVFMHQWYMFKLALSNIKKKQVQKLHSAPIALGYEESQKKPESSSQSQDEMYDIYFG